MPRERQSLLLNKPTRVFIKLFSPAVCMTEARTDNNAVQEICQRCKYEVASVKLPVDVVTTSKPVMANHAPTVFTLFK